MNMRRFVLL